MEYLTRKFENTQHGIAEKDECTRLLAAQGFKIVSEQLEQGHIKGNEQCCGALICLPLIFLAGRTPGTILVTYGREQFSCISCGQQLPIDSRVCTGCGVKSSGNIVADQDSARALSENNQTALRRTVEINQAIQKLNAILLDGIAVDHRCDPGTLVADLSVPQPQFEFLDELTPPRSWIMQFLSRVALFESLFPSIRRNRLKWEEAIERNNRNREAAESSYAASLSEWSVSNEAAKRERTAQIELKKQTYLAKDHAAVIEYSAAVLHNSPYPIMIPSPSQLSFSEEENEVLVVHFDLPPVSCLPCIGEVRFLAEKNILEEIPVSLIWRNETYQNLIIQIALRTIYELFQSDLADALKTVTFNGFVRTIDRSIGREICPVVVSIKTSKAEFMDINLAEVNPESCFNRLNGLLSNEPWLPTPATPVQAA